MQRSTIDLNTFKRDHTFYGELHLMATVKNFDLQAIRKRYLESKKNKSALTGSVERRPPAMGGLVACRLDKGQLLDYKVLSAMKEPRGIASSKGQLAYSSENVVHLIKDGQKKDINDPWFSYIHTVDFSKDGKRILVSSSGFDVIFECDVETGHRTYEWWAWENGFDKGKDPKTGEATRLSRVDLAATGPMMVISDPTRDVLPTAMRAAFINSVEYDKENEQKMIATFFHEGAVYRIDRGTGHASKVISNLKNPHGGMNVDNGYMATSTRGGEVVLKQVEAETRYLFQDLPNKPKGLEKEEWLQNSKRLDDGSILTIDSNRTAFIIFHPQKELLDIIPYPDNLALQDLIICTGDDIEDWIKSI
jgi:hypothetical protein